MHFIKRFSKVVVSVLLATSALGHVAQIPSSDAGLILAERAAASGASDLGTDPRGKTGASYFSKHCSKAVKKGGKRETAEGEEEEDEIQVLEARAGPPAGYDNVPMGRAIGRKTTEHGLWSDGFGTCVGVVVTGTPRQQGGLTRFLFHISLGVDWADIRKPWYEFAEAVRSSGMTNMKGYIYTVDISPNAADIRADTSGYLADEARALAPTYQRIHEKLQQLVGRNTVVSYTHPFSKVGTMQVGTDNRVSTSN